MDDQSLRDLFEGLGTISIRRMFGGKGIYHQGLIVALVVQDELLLKADQESAPAFIAAGSTQWTYDGRKNGKTVAMPYWSVPDEAYDDPEIMTEWARLAFAASLRSEAKK
ncbi:competence protein TfoX [Brucella pseudogrignonensis]|jgi:DNA transformation protein|uniref:TfoX/Sxy family protein n=1 Tax=Brucella pseudogrignonensis TaxID=419475 RepID=UPI0007DA9A30|nr:TfoX/Sxy family protein [Brucella pseudogrignonensis]ANG95767.1 competence protein TfoX [Brucella pseudogrignonensis]KAB2691506.1 TfoX/Sxy family protein [Brucella pseudogrignonensis]MBO1023951.1 TfoX/Sxy family protein [Ochrobactrum sp. SD129]